ncbi:hypothetical protein PUS82_00345 [Cytobacillus firmus]|uniref:hypothetical protein n=1 Tax=Cytobacillus firmus TaxID=1399 RepID=UPI00237B6692|nr:hypothetical protein [Cytobacillus firmus]MDD9309780.1 hypothetical protein [Cytobacillus firmus]
MPGEVIVFRYLPYVIQTISVFLACVAGFLVYSGLSSAAERRQTRIRIRTQIEKSKERLVEGTKHSKAEEWLNKAQYPLKITGVKYYVIIGSFLSFLFIYYVFLPFLLNGPGKGPFIAFICIILLGLFLLPSNPLSLFVYLMKRIIEYHNAKKHAEVFMLYDLLINEIEMMTVTRINTYSILRNIKPYFIVLEKPMTMLLSSWSSDEGPKVALERFEKELHSKEAKALIAVMKTLDDVERETALSHLRGMHSMFIRTQIENYRRKKKVTTDIMGLPIKITHFLIILNFLIVVVTMVTFIMQSTRY